MVGDICATEGFHRASIVDLKDSLVQNVWLLMLEKISKISDFSKYID